LCRVTNLAQDFWKLSAVVGLDLQCLAGIGKLEIVNPILLNDLLDLPASKALYRASHQCRGWHILGKRNASLCGRSNRVECRLLVVCGQMHLFFLFSIDRLEVGAKGRLGIASIRAYVGRVGMVWKRKVVTFNNKIVIVPVFDLLLHRQAGFQT
jgi:hypothetical protein